MAKCVQALYDYEKCNDDELSFKKGDTLFVHKENESGWWLGSSNGVQGLFPSNFVIPISKLRVNMKSLQYEIINHIIEGEIKQIKEISIILNEFVVYVESFSSIPFVNKIRNLKNLLIQGQNLHQDLATSLEEVKDQPNAQIISEIFANKADSIDEFGCNISNIYYHLMNELERNCEKFDKYLLEFEDSCDCNRARYYLKSIFERLCKYPFLLKEYERYLDDNSQERIDLSFIIKKYILIVNRIELMKRFKEMDIIVKNSKIEGWTLDNDLNSFGDPILTLRILLADDHSTRNQPSSSDKSLYQSCILSLFHSFLFIFSTTEDASLIKLKHAIPICGIEKMDGTIVDNSLVNEILNYDERKQQSWHINIRYSCKALSRPKEIVIIAAEVVSHQYLHSTLNQLQRSNEPSSEKPTKEGLINREQIFYRNQENSTSRSIHDRQSYTEGTLVRNSSLKEQNEHLANQRIEKMNRYSCFANSALESAQQQKMAEKNACIDREVLNKYILNRNAYNLRRLQDGTEILELGHLIYHEPLCFWPKEFDFDQFNDQMIEMTKKRKDNDQVRKMEILRVNYPTRNELSIENKRSSIHGQNYSPIRSSNSNRDKSKDDGSLLNQHKNNDSAKKENNITLRENRRRRQGRQKSAIDADEVLKSMAKFHKENLLFDDSDLLNIIELYCKTPLQNRINCLNLESLRSLEIDSKKAFNDNDRPMPSGIYRVGSHKYPLNFSRSSQILT